MTTARNLIDEFDELESLIDTENRATIDRDVDMLRNLKDQRERLLQKMTENQRTMVLTDWSEIPSEYARCLAAIREEERTMMTTADLVHRWMATEMPIERRQLYPDSQTPGPTVLFVRSDIIRLTAAMRRDIKLAGGHYCAAMRGWIV
jgi:hypothetical protein